MAQNSRLRLVLQVIVLLAAEDLFGRIGYAESLKLSSILKNGAVRVETQDGQVLLAHRDQELFIPASTLKVATAFCALEELGPNYRFSTHFFTDGMGKLFVRGSGDPTLVSEELKDIAANISTLLPRIDEITIDSSLFEENLSLDGASKSSNPYDAQNAAFVGNFSTAYIRRHNDGSIISAEPQTPLTSLSRRLGARIKKGTSERINLGRDGRTGTLYGGELLAAFLKAAGVKGELRVSLGTVPSSARQLLTHASSQDLAETAQAMLKYSTNFTANQIFLLLGIHAYGGPATVQKGQRALSACLQSRAGLRGVHIEEGSGLSRKNALSAHHMTQLLQKFSPYQNLLDTKDGFTAKTGSLQGVGSLAGYFDTPNSGRVRFAILINSPMPHLYKFTAAKQIREHLIASGF